MTSDLFVRAPRRLVSGVASSTRVVCAVMGLTLSVAPVACGSTAGSTTISFGSRDGGASEASRLHGGPGCSSGSKDADCACVAGQQRPCYTGPTGTLGVGACKAGVQTCVATQEAQFAYGPCEGETLPSATNGGCIAAGRPDATVHVDAGKPDVTVHVDAWTPPDAAVDGAYPVLFGGVGNVALSDTWVWNGSAWSEVAATGPGGGDGRANTVMAPLGGQLVLFGGWDYGGGSGADFSDTWIWNGAAWNQLAVTGPSARLDAVMAPLGGELVLFGGFTDSGDVELGDTWTWDGTQWAQLNVTGPSARSLAVMAPLGDKLVLFGGGTGSAYLADTWTWDGTAWTQLSVTGPSARAYSAMAPLGDKLVLFGGACYGGGCVDPSGWAEFSDTWTWDGTAWTELSVTGPSGRGQAVMAPLGDKLVLYGGTNSTGVLSDTWMWDGTAWTQLNVSGPPARTWTVMATP